MFFVCVCFFFSTEIKASRASGFFLENGWKGTRREGNGSIYWMTNKQLKLCFSRPNTVWASKMDAVDRVGYAASSVGAELAAAAKDRLRPEYDGPPCTRHVIRSPRCRRTRGMEEPDDHVVPLDHRRCRSGNHLLRFSSHSPFGIFVSALFCFLILFTCWISPVDGVFAPLMSSNLGTTTNNDAYRPLREKESKSLRFLSFSFFFLSLQGFFGGRPEGIF